MTAPMAGPMTRDRFICTDCSETAPGRSARGTRVGRIAAIPGALSELPTPIAKTQTTSATRDGLLVAARPASTTDRTSCSSCVMIKSLRRSTVGGLLADRRHEQQRPELREEQDPDEDGRTGELVSECAEEHILHPRADVRRERPAPEDAEVAVPQRRLRRPPP